MLNITIPQPCHENWRKMEPTAKGAFCKACAKEVVDFSNMTDAEVKNYFVNRTEKNTCGRFNYTQLNNIDVHISTDILFKRIAGWKKFLAIVLLSFGSMLFGCTVHTIGKADKAQEDIIDTSGQSESILGALTFDVNTVTRQEEACFTKMGLTLSTPIVVQGDIMISDSIIPGIIIESIPAIKDTIISIEKDSLSPAKKIPADTTDCRENQIYSK